MSLSTDNVEAPGEAFEPYVRAWFDYLPVAAWKSRLNKLRSGFAQMTKGLRTAGLLREGWTPEAAADWIYALTQLDTWQHLVLEGGWKPNAAVDRIVAALRETLIKTA